MLALPLPTVARPPPVGTVRRYAYLNTLVSALSRRLLSVVELRDLVEQSMTEAGALLRAVGLETMAGEETTDRSLEQRLVDVLVAEAQRLIRPLAGEAQGLVCYWLRHFEIANLKAVIRGKIAGHPNHVIRADLMDLGAIAALPLEALMEAEGAPEMLRRLEGTPYAEMARHTRAVYEEHRIRFHQKRSQEWFLIEAVIDREYFAGLDKRVRMTSDPDRHYLGVWLGAVIDQVNLVWLLRYRLVYRLTPPLTYFLLCPGGYHLHRRQLLTLVRGESLEEILRQVPSPLDSVVAGSRTIAQVEARLEWHVSGVARFLLSRTFFNLGRVFAYLFLREKDLWRLYGIFKGRHLHFASPLIHQAIGVHNKDASETVFKSRFHSRVREVGEV